MNAFFLAEATQLPLRGRARRLEELLHLSGLNALNARLVAFCVFREKESYLKRVRIFRRHIGCPDRVARAWGDMLFWIKDHR